MNQDMHKLQLAGVEEGDDVVDVDAAAAVADDSGIVHKAARKREEMGWE